MHEATRLSRKRKKWLRRHCPLGVVNDPVVLGNPERRWGRQSFIAERGHAKNMWRDLWEIWAPTTPDGTHVWRFVRTKSWFIGMERRMPRGLRRVIGSGVKT